MAKKDSVEIATHRDRPTGDFWMREEWEEAFKKRIRLVDIIDRLALTKEVFFHYVETVADVMTRKVKFLTLDDRLGDGLFYFKEHAVRQVPIVEVVEPERGKKGPIKHLLVGMVAAEDVSRMISVTVGTLSQTEADDKILSKPLGQLIRRNYETCDPDDALAETVQRMLDEGLDCMPVIVGPKKEREIVGLLTSNDIIRCLTRMDALRRAREKKGGKGKQVRLIDLVGGQQSDQASDLLLSSLMGTVTDVMKDTVATIASDQSLGDAMKILEKGVRSIPVLAGGGKLMGMVCDLTVLRYLPQIPEQKGLASVTAKPNPFQMDEEDPESTRILRDNISVALTVPPASVESNSALVKAAEIFCGHDVDAIPVMDSDGGGLAGVITRADFLGAFLAIGRIAQSTR